MEKRSHRQEPDSKSPTQVARGRMYLHMIVLVLLTVGVFAAMAIVYFPQQAHRGAVHRTAAARESVANLIQQGSTV